MNNTNKRLEWIDYGKGICMLVVIFYHTLCYYTQNERLTFLFFPFFLTFFFFLSGYVIDINKFNFRKSIKSIIQRLFIPYLIFTSIIWLPKAISHNSVISIKFMLCDILGGYASWFIAALIVAKATLSGIMIFTKSLKIIWIIALIFILIGFVSTIYIDHPAPWYYNYGFISLIYILLGSTYRKYKDNITLTSTRYLICSIIIYISLIFLNKLYPTSIYYYNMTSNNISFLGIISYMILSLSGIWMMINIVTALPINLRLLKYVGKNSLIYYFLNGGVITVCVIVCNSIGLNYNGVILREVLFYIIIIAILTIISLFINKFCPWMIGIYKPKIKKI